MRVPRLIVYLAVGFLFASALLLFFGPGGLLEYRAAARYGAQLRSNIEELEGVNAKLRGELAALRSDPELLRLRAREMGYFREDEHVIRVEGGTPPRNSYTVGRLVLRKSPTPRPSWYYRAAGLGLPAALLLARTIRLLCRRRARPRGARVRGGEGDAAAA